MKKLTGLFCSLFIVVLFVVYQANNLVDGLHFFKGKSGDIQTDTYTIVLDSNAGFSNSGSSTIVKWTGSGNDIVFSYQNISIKSGYMGTLAMGSFFQNETAISGLTEIKGIFDEDVVYVDYGYLSEGVITYEVINVQLSTSESYDFDGDLPSYIKIHANSDVNVFSFQLTYSCFASPNPYIDGVKRTITYNLGSGATNSISNPSTFSVGVNDIVLSDPSRDGYLFTGWTSDSTIIPTKNYLITKETADDVIVNANWYKSTTISSNMDNIDYIDTESEYNKYYVLNVDENYFTLITVILFKDGRLTYSADCGAFVELSDSIYRLDFIDSTIASMYIKILGSTFVFSNAEGTPLSEVGNEGVTLPLYDEVPPALNKKNYGYRSLGLESNGNSLQNAYNAIWNDCLEFSKNESDVVNDYLISSVNGNSYSLETDEVLSVISTFFLDNPEYYWISNTITVFDATINLLIDNDYVLSTYREECDNQINAMKGEAKVAIAGKTSDLDIYLSLHDFIINRVDYAYKDDGATPETDSWAHNIVGVANKNGAVCEGYSEAFRLLCLDAGLECINLTGTIISTNESHEWNLITVDGIYYEVDVTWDDSSSGSSYGFFGMSYSTANVTRALNSNIHGPMFLYQLPAISSTDMNLVGLYKNDVFVQTCTNIDSAFTIMTDSNGIYEIMLFSYGMSSGPLLLSNTYYFYISTANWPDVQSIDIYGTHYDLGSGYYTSTILCLNQDSILNSNLTFENILGQTKTHSEVFELNGFSLLFSGWCVYQNFRFIGDGESEIVANSLGQLEFCLPINVSKVNISGDVVIRDKFDIDYLTINENSRLRCYGMIAVDECHIGTIYSNANNPCLSFDNMSNVVNVTIDNVNVSNGNLNLLISATESEHHPNVLFTSQLTSNLTYVFYGQRTIVTTDVDGNEIATWTEYFELEENKRIFSSVGFDSTHCLLWASIYNVSIPIYYPSSDYEFYITENGSGDYFYYRNPDYISS